MLRTGEAVPFFIVGAPRSGTTLLGRVLGSHSRLFVPGETHFFPDIFARRQAIGDLTDAASRARLRQRLATLYERYNEPADQQRVNHLLESEAFLSDLDRLGSYPDALDYFMRAQALAVGRTRWGNHVPRDLFHVEDILAFYPRARFIACVRDVRDFLGSYKYKWQATAPDQRDRLRRLYHPVVTALLWRASMRRLQALRSTGRAQLHLVRYEDLVTNPAAIVPQVCAFLGEDFQGQMLKIEFSNSSRGGAARGIDDSSVGTWRETLSNEEVWIAQRIAGDNLREFGYRPQAVQAHAGKIAGLLASTPWSLAVALRANAANRGPLLPYLARRVRALTRA